MVNVNTGSIVQLVLDSISPMPAGISGAMIRLVDSNRYYVENWTGITIGSVIGEAYQDPIFNLTVANTLKLMAVQDLGVQNVSVGDLSTDNKNLFEMAKQFEERANIELKSLMKSVRFSKTYG